MRAPMTPASGLRRIAVYAHRQRRALGTGEGPTEGSRRAPCSYQQQPAECDAPPGISAEPPPGVAPSAAAPMRSREWTAIAVPTIASACRSTTLEARAAVTARPLRVRTWRKGCSTACRRPSFPSAHSKRCPPTLSPKRHPACVVRKRNGSRSGRNLKNWNADRKPLFNRSPTAPPKAGLASPSDDTLDQLEARREALAKQLSANVSKFDMAAKIAELRQRHNPDETELRMRHFMLMARGATMRMPSGS